jgi:hypothetical protein
MDMIALIPHHLEESAGVLMSRYNPVKGLFDSWLTPDLYREGRALL